MSGAEVDIAKSGPAPPLSPIARLRDSDVAASFLSSRTTVAAGLIATILIVAGLAAPLIAPTDPFNPAANFLMDSLTPPRFVAGGDPRFLLGTDDQGRDLWSAILYGLRISLMIGFLSVLLGGAIGVGLGLIAGYAGGWIDSVIMRDRRRAAHFSRDPDRFAAGRRRARASAEVEP